MEIETVIGLLRNGFCVVKDLEIAGMAPLAAVQSLVPNMTAIESLIAPLQACAIYFNFVGGTLLFAGAVTSWQVLAQWSKVLEDPALGKEAVLTIAKGNLAAARKSAVNNAVTAVCLWLIGFGFIWFFLCSLHLVYFDLLNWGIIAMEIALAVLLFYMSFGVSRTWSDAADARAAARSISEAAGHAFLASAPPDVLATCGHAMGAEPPLAPWPGPAANYLAGAYVASLDAWRGDALKRAESKQARNAASAALTAKAQGLVLTGWLDLAVVILNVVAFAGYAVFPLTYLVTEVTIKANAPWWPGNEYAEWLGNLLGDAAWTVEPALVLLFKPMIQRLVQDREKLLLDPEKKTK